MKSNVKKLVYAALFSGLALVIGLFQIPTPFQSYLHLDGSEIIILTAGNFFGFGVMSTTIILRSLLRFALGMSSGQFFIGELAAVISSFIFGGSFLLIKRLTKSKTDTYKLNLGIIIILAVLLVPFSIYAFKANGGGTSGENNWLILGLCTMIIPVLCFIIMNIFKRNFCYKYSTQLLQATTAILLNSVIMTFLNWLVITPSNALGKPAIFTDVLREFHTDMTSYVYVFILPLIPFNILKGIISFIIFYMIEKTIAKVVARNA